MEETPQNKYLVPLAIIVAGGLVAAAIYFGTGSDSRPVATVNGNSQNTEIDLVPVTEKDHIIGTRSATLVIVEYSDTECPFCKTFHNTMHQVVRDYEGQVAWVYRHFPIAQLHTKAAKEAEATECANELGGNQVFWSYINKLFDATNSNDSLDPAELPKIAQAVGLNVAAFNACLSSGKYTEFIKKGVEDAVKAGARGTPYSIILLEQPLSANQVSSIKNIVDANRLFDPNGQPLINISVDKKKISASGALPFNILKKVLDSAMQ